MKWFESAITWLFPRLLIQGTAWEADWWEQERSNFITIARIMLPLTSIVWLAHYYLYDLPMGLEPTDQWFLLRSVLSTVMFVAFLFYCSPLAKRSGYKGPAVVAAWGLCFGQSIAVFWYGQQAWIFGFILVFASVMMLRMPPFQSVVFALFTIGSQSYLYIKAGLSAPDILTGTLVIVSMSLVVRSSYASEVKYYLLNKDNITAQQQIAELSSELASRIRAFIPKVIADRMDYAVQQERKSIVEASINVLEPKRKEIACLFSDIRGFTKGSENLEDFINSSVIPEVKACSDALERYEGIPRKIGDLVFAYFDGPFIEKNVLGAVLAGFDIAKLNKDINETLSVKNIRRYILISSGEAIVGNIGGLDSSIEITALGPPVNFLSRLDDATKHPELEKLLKHGDIVLSEDCFVKVPSLFELDYLEINLFELDIEIRDFLDTKFVYRIEPTETNRKILATIAMRENGGLNGERRDTMAIPG